MLNKLAIATLALFLSVGVADAAGPPNGINTTVPKTDPAGGYPAGKKGIGATGAYTCPLNKTIAKVVVTIYRQDAGGVLTPVGQVDDQAPAGGNYATGYISLDSTKQYSGISVMYVNGANPGDPSVPFGATGSFLNYTP